MRIAGGVIVMMVVVMTVIIMIIMIGMGVFAFLFVIGSRLGFGKFGSAIGKVDNFQTLGIVSDLFLHAALEGHPGSEPDFGAPEVHCLSGGRRKIVGILACAGQCLDDDMVATDGLHDGSLWRDGNESGDFSRIERLGRPATSCEE